MHHKFAFRRHRNIKLLFFHFN
uniref:Uncharacterized protein n=1 Tax=Arundo donax TaxID=35708 RepID=A0A0A8YJB3_ARUDO